MYEVAIQKDILNSGEEILTPVFREKSRFKFLNTPWRRICNIDGIYELHEFDTRIPFLTIEQCQERIDGYKAYLKEKSKNKIKNSDFVNLEVIDDGEVKTRFLLSSIL